MSDKKERRKQGFENVSSILQSALRPYHNEFDDKLGVLISQWPQVAGQVVAAHCEPFAIKEQKLFVKVDSAAWLHHLQFLKDDLIIKVNAQMQTSTVNDIHFKVKDMSGGKPGR